MRNLLSIVLLAGTLGLYAQPFRTTPVINPFGVGPAQSHYRVAFEDMDNDGDIDLLMLDAFGNNSPFIYRQNTGTATAPNFVATTVNNPFGLQSVNFMNNFFLVDWDNDGDKDLFGGGNAGFFYYQNTGSAVQPAFAAPVMNPFGLVAPAGSNTLIPTLGDVDGDGLRDLLVGDYNANLYFYKNTGTANAPAFMAPQASPFGYVKPSGNPVFLAPVLKDVNDDGLLDLFVGFNPGRIRLYTNTGSITTPQFGASVANPLGLNTSNYNVWAMPIFYDMDADGDDDLLVTTFSNLQYHENLRMASQTEEMRAPEIQMIPNPATDYVRISLNEAFSATVVWYRILNMHGQTLLTGSMDRLVPKDISLSGLEKGAYWLEIRSEGRTLSRKFVKN